LELRRILYGLEPLKKVPLAGPLLERAGMAMLRKKEWHDVALFLENRLKPRCARQSILFFTVHKCASGYVGRILKRVAAEAGILPIDLEAYFWIYGDILRDIYKGEKISGDKYKKQGYYYGPFRHWLPSLRDTLDDYRVICMLRDPRDVLTSLYYSVAYNQVDPGRKSGGIKGFRAYRKETLGMTIDDFVLKEADGFLSRYKIYCKEFLKRDNVLFIRYEDMICDFKDWLERILNFLNIEISEGTKKAIIEKASGSVKKENKSRHRRKVTPGDHKEKLRSDTIKELNRKYGEILTELEYDV